jgi:hypothetical protein
VLGHVRMGLGRDPELAVAPGVVRGQPEASYALGLWLAQAGRAKDGLGLLRHACRLNPHERRYAVGLTDLLLLVDEPPADLGDTLLTLYDTPRIDHTRWAPRPGAPWPRRRSAPRPSPGRPTTASSCGCWRCRSLKRGSPGP